MGAGLIDDPYPRAHELRARCPVHTGTLAEEVGLGYPGALSADAPRFSVLGYEDALRVFRDHSAFSSTWFQRNIGPTVGNTALIALDPPEHQRQRSLLQPAFALREMDRWETEIVRPVVAAYAGALAPRGRGDLYAELAAYVPIAVTARALGLPPEDRELFVD
jgi:cytochrome P450